MSDRDDFAAIKQMMQYKGDAAAATANYSGVFKSVQGEVSPEEWKARVDVAACYRLVDAYGMGDLIYNHITVR